MSPPPTPSSPAPEIAVSGLRDAKNLSLPIVWLRTMLHREPCLSSEAAYCQDIVGQDILSCGGAGSSDPPSDQDDHVAISSLQAEHTIPQSPKCATVDEVKCALAALTACDLLDAPPTPTTPTIQHIQQIYNWDCGIVCLQMVLQWLQKDGMDTEAHQQQATRQRLLQYAATESVWSIDLVAALEQELQKAPLARYLFLTKCLDVNHNLAHVNYYQAAFDEDAPRVRHRLDWLRQQSAHGRLLQVPWSISLAQIVHAVACPNIVAVLLVDNAILQRQSKTNQNDCAASAPASDDLFVRDRSVASSISSRGYAGHYILLTDVIVLTNAAAAAAAAAASNDGRHDDRAADLHFVVHDPGQAQGPVHLSGQLVDAARCALGTDEDIIFCVAQRG